MPTCPGGHDTQGTDFCDVCGIRVSSPAQAPAQAPAGAGAASRQRCPQCGADRPGQFCEACGYSFASAQAAAGRGRGATVPSHVAAVPSHVAAVPSQAVATGPGQAAGSGTAATGAGEGAGPGTAATGPGEGPASGTAAPAAWTAVVTADRAYFDRVVADRGPDAGTLQFPAACPERQFRLSGPEMRIGRRSVSRGLEPEIDLTGPPADPGVSHLHAVLTAEPDGGWTVLDPGSANGTLVNDRKIPAGARVRLRDGDRICVGAWTVMTIRTA